MSYYFWLNFDLNLFISLSKPFFFLFNFPSSTIYLFFFHNSFLLSHFLPFFPIFLLFLFFLSLLSFFYLLISSILLRSTICLSFLLLPYLFPHLFFSFRLPFSTIFLFRSFPFNSSFHFFLSFLFFFPL